MNKQTPTVSHLDVPLLLEGVIKDRYGFFAEHDIAALALSEQGRLIQVLVRTGRSRFTCAVQDVEFLIESISQNGDYIRDVSIPVKRA